MEQKDKPKKEQAVRDTLASRPAGVIDDILGSPAEETFTGLFNGALRKGYINPDNGLFVGKAECEWNWPEAWDTLVEMGLITYKLEKRDYPQGGGTTELYWFITEKGWQVREDDLKWFSELIDARRKDEDEATA